MSNPTRLAEGLRHAREAQYEKEYDAVLAALSDLKRVLAEDAEYWRRRRQWWRFWGYGR